MHVRADVGESSAGCLRLRFGDGVAVAGITPASEVLSSPEEERQANGVAAGFAEPRLLTTTKSRFLRQIYSASTNA